MFVLVSCIHVQDVTMYIVTILLTCTYRSMELVVLVCTLQMLEGLVSEISVCLSYKVKLKYHINILRSDNI